MIICWHVYTDTILLCAFDPQMNSLNRRSCLRERQFLKKNVKNPYTLPTHNWFEKKWGGLGLNYKDAWWAEGQVNIYFEVVNIELLIASLSWWDQILSYRQEFMLGFEVALEN